MSFLIKFIIVFIMSYLIFLLFDVLLTWIEDLIGKHRMKRMQRFLKKRKEEYEKGK